MHFNTHPELITYLSQKFSIKKTSNSVILRRYALGIIFAPTLLLHLALPERGVSRISIN